MAIKFNELMKNYEKFFDEVSTLKNKELVEFDKYLYLFDKLIDTDSSFAKLYHKIDDEVVGLDSDKKILAFMFALDELGHIDVSHATFNESKKSARKSLKESYNSEVDLMYDYETIFKNTGWRVDRNPLKDNILSAMHISISKNTEDGQVCFYIYCDWGVDGYGDYYSCQINDCSDAKYDYDAINYKGFEVSGRGFLLFERNQTKFCKYLEQTLNELANLKVEKVNESKKSERKRIAVWC